MDSNTSSDTQTSTPRRPPARLAALTRDIQELVAQDLDRLPDTALAEEVEDLRWLGDRLEGQWLRRLAAVDARGAAGAEEGTQEGSTAGWLRRRLRLGAGTASSAVRTARALFRGPLTQTAQALCAGELSPAHATVLAQGTHDLPAQVTAEAEPVLVEAARRLDPPRLRQAVGYLVAAVDLDREEARAERRHQRRGLWLSPTWDGMVAIDGLLEPEAGQTVLAALEPLARPAEAGDDRSGGQRTADALTELARRALEGGRLPTTGGVRPQLLVTVELDSLLSHPGSGALPGDLGGVGLLDPEGCRRLACDGTVTRVLVTRHSHGQGSTVQEPLGARNPTEARDPTASRDPTVAPDPNQVQGLEQWLRAAAAKLPPTLGGAPSQPLDVGRASRVVTPAQHRALAVRDGGCVFPGCSRPLAWCEGHHLIHWLDGGLTDLANLVLLCRSHHRAVHEGGWRLSRQPDGRLTATPPYRRHRTARRHGPAA